MIGVRAKVLLAAALAAGLLTWLLVGVGKMEPGGGPSSVPGGLAGRRLTYRFGWEDLPAGEAVLTVKPAAFGQRRAWWVSCEARSAPALRPVGSFRVSGWSLVEAAALRPLRSQSNTWRQEGRKQRTARFDYERGLVEVTQHEAPEGELELLHVPLSGHLDPAALLLRAAAGELPSRTMLLVGDDQYELRSRREGADAVAGPSGWQQARRWGLTVRQVEPEADERTEHVGRLWLSERGGVPLRLEADLLVGRLTARLVSTERLSPTDGGPPAQAQRP